MMNERYDSPRTHVEGARCVFKRQRVYSIRHPYLIAALLFLITFLILPEIALQLFDPWKVNAYFDDLAAVLEHMRADPLRGYVNAPGSYVYSNWTVTIDRHGWRVVPATHPAPCRIALLGDSVTFGYGVSDNQTWANQVAQDFLNVEIIDTGASGYNIGQVAATQPLTHASGYLYLLINNDADPPLNWQPTHNPPRAYQFGDALQTYLYVWQTRHQGVAYTQPDYQTFDRVLAQLETISNVMIVGFTNDPLAARAKVPVIPPWTHANSYTDGHANAEGNQQIAASLQPYLADLIQGVCYAGH